MKKLITLLFILNLVGCSNMMSNLYRQLDAGEGKRASRGFRSKSKAYSPYKRSLADSQNQRTLLPPVKRFYQDHQRPQTTSKRKRVTADNFYESKQQANLWSGRNAANLYTQNSSVSSGDIVIINVMGDLKTDISQELKRAFPMRVRKKRGVSKDTKTEEAAKNETKEKDPNTNKIHDRISSIVMDIVNKDYVTVRGRKELLYHNKKHSIEIQALVHKKDISLNNYIKSDAIIEKQIRVIY